MYQTEPEPGAWAGVRCLSRAARCSAARARSTGCSTFADSTRINESLAPARQCPAGGYEECCPISEAENQQNVAPTHIMASAARWRCRTGGTPIRCRKLLSSPQRRPAFPQIPTSRRDAGRRGLLPDHDAARQTGEYGVFLSSTGQGARQSACRDRRAGGRRILFEGRRARAVGVPAGQQLRAARARKRDLVSGGAYNSAQLLQLSGVGPAELFEAARHRKSCSDAPASATTCRINAGQAGDALRTARHPQ